MPILLLSALGLLQPAPAPLLVAGDPPCTAEDRALPEDLSGWREHPGEGLALDVGHPQRVALQPVARVGFVRPPEREPGAGSRGAAVPVEIMRAGRYQLALSGPASVDMVVGADVAASMTDEPGPRCSGIRKLVEYDLPAGRHLLQLSGIDARDIVAMIAPAGNSPVAGRR